MSSSLFNSLIHKLPMRWLEPPCPEIVLEFAAAAAYIPRSLRKNTYVQNL